MTTSGPRSATIRAVVVAADRPVAPDDRRDPRVRVAISAAAFGLVRLVHSNLVDRIEETNQQQLDSSQAADRSRRARPEAHPTICFDARGPHARLLPEALPGRKATTRTAQRQVRLDRRPHHARRAAVDRGGEPHRRLRHEHAAVRGARHDRARRVRSVVLRRARAQAGRGDPPAGRGRSPAPPSTGACPSPTPTTRSAASPAR